MANDIDIPVFLSRMEEVLNEMVYKTESVDYEKKFRHLLSHVETLIWFINSEMENAKQVYSSFKDKELSVNAIEAEAALRVFYIIQDHIEQLVEDVPELQKEEEMYSDVNEEVPF